MATVIPFQAWRYNLERVRIDRVVAPPYDVISREEQEALYGRDPFNIVKVECGKVEVSDNELHNQYERAAKYWESWIQQSVIQQDKVKSFYLLSTLFKDPESGEKKRRLVIFGLIKLEPFEARVVLPHEKTHAGAKEDRLKLLQTTKTNFSPVFGLYEDKQKLAHSLYSAYASIPPLFSFSLENGEEHQLWQISSLTDVQNLSQMFESKSILIADGHHRYETALYYRNLDRSKRDQNGLLSSDYVLMGFVEVEDEGLLILPIHRVVKNLKGINPTKFVEELTGFFSIKKTSEDKLHAIARGGSDQGFGLALPTANFYFWLKDKAEARKEMLPGKPESWYGLEVTQISYLVLKRLGIREEALEHYVEYTRSSEEAIQHVKARKANLAFIVPPIKAKVMREICMAGELMPQKSTYFYPKLGSGILMYRHE